MATIVQFDTGDKLTGGQLRIKNQQVSEVVQKGYQLVCADNAPTVQEASTEMMAEMVDEEMDDYDRAVGNATPTPRIKNPMAYRKAERILDREGHVIFAYVEEDEKANREIIFCQKYLDGTFSRKLSILQADVFTIMLANKDKQMESRADKACLKIGLEYVNSFCGNPDDLISVKNVVKMVAEQIQFLPVYHDDLTEVERVGFYQSLVGMIKGMTSQVLNDHRAYYPLSTEDMEYITRNLGTTKVKLLKSLKKYDLLYLTPSSKGYQTNVRLNGMGEDSFTTWRYCILRDEALENDEDLEYSYDF